MKRNGFSLIELLVIVGVIALVAAIIMPVLMRAREPHRSSCQNNLKQLGLGIAQYTQDYDERMPLTVVTSASLPDDPATKVNEAAHYGWADAIQPYVKAIPIYHCPSLPHPKGINPPFAPLARDCTDYWLNANVAGQNLQKVSSAPQILLLGDGNDGSDLTDARYNLRALPAGWINDENSPAYRHNGLANYGFLDGHVKALAPEQITNGSPDKGMATFAVK
jgi:prepilin-type processing-associated H-X9-DG protein